MKWAMGASMRSLVRVLAALILAVVMAAASRAGDAPAPSPVATLQLQDGRVLHNVRVMSCSSEGIVVSADEGLLKIPRANLPDAIAQALPAAPARAAGSGSMVMQPFNPDLAQVSPTPKPKPSPRPKPSPTPKPTPNPVFKGCTIVSFQAKPFQNVLGAAEVVIRNDTDAAVAILPGDIACVTDSGALLRGRQFVVDAYPPILRRREIIPAHGNLDEQVTFVSEALVITAVRWSR